jgi:hypothetical protein
MSNHRKMPPGASGNTPADAKSPGAKKPKAPAKASAKKDPKPKTVGAEIETAGRRGGKPDSAPGPRRTAPAQPAEKAKAAPQPKPAATKPLPAVPKPAPAAPEPEASPHLLASAVDSFERSFKAAGRGTLAVNCKLLDFARANVNSGLDYVKDLAAARSPARIMRLQVEYWHDCLETFVSQTQELRALSAELVADANAPLREHVCGTRRAG